MKIIQSGRKYLGMLGVFPNQSLNNVKIFITVTVSATNVGGNFAFLFHEANTFIEYANSTFITLSATMVAVCFVISSVYRSRIFALIDAGNDLVKKSE